jgi:hypothetical protein
MSGAVEGSFKCELILITLSPQVIGSTKRILLKAHLLLRKEGSADPI